MSSISGIGSAANSVKMVQESLSESLQMRNGLIKRMMSVQVEGNVKANQLTPINQKDDILGQQVDVQV